MAQFAAMSRQSEEQNQTIIHNLVELRKELTAIRRVLEESLELEKRRGTWLKYNGQGEVNTSSQSQKP
jgi:hypothetical protein